MASSAARLAGRRDHASGAVRRALGSTALGRIPADEEAWLTLIEAWRRRLASEAEVAAVVREGSGAVSERLEHPPHHLASALPWWSVPRVWGRFLMRLVSELRPRSCLELGTGFGISGAYQAAALKLSGAGTLITLDVPAEWSIIAERGFSELGLDGRVAVRRGKIERTLTGAVHDAGPVDYAFLDAEHTESATVSHFDAVLAHLAPGAVAVVDDITRSPDMRRAWRAIRRRERVTRAVGLGRMGVTVIG